MIRYLLRRIGYGFLILIGVNLLTFMLFFTVNTPDDMARLNIGGKRVTAEAIQNRKEEHGYDKPLRSRYETFFVSNNTSASVAALSLTISYYNTAGELLHRTPRRVSVDIPAGETRQVSLRSWDKQFAFYYTRSTVPARTGTATPYEIAMTVDTVFTVRRAASVK